MAGVLSSGACGTPARDPICAVRCNHELDKTVCGCVVISLLQTHGSSLEFTTRSQFEAQTAMSETFFFVRVHFFSRLLRLHRWHRRSRGIKEICLGSTSVQKVQKFSHVEHFNVIKEGLENHA